MSARLRPVFVALSRSHYYSIAPALERYRSIEYLYQPFLREIHARRAELASVDSPLARDVQAVIKQLLGHAIQISSKAQTAEMLDLCLNLDDLLACGQVLAKLASSPTEAIAAFAGVSAVLKKAKLPPTTPTFRSFYKLAIMQYVQAMTAPPSSDVSRLLDGFRKIACRCEECRKLVSFMDSEQGALHLRNAQDHASRVIRTVPQWDAVLTLSFSSAKIARGKSLDVRILESAYRMMNTHIFLGVKEGACRPGEQVPESAERRSRCHQTYMLR